jgi:hypothetical protein
LLSQLGGTIDSGRFRSHPLPEQLKKSDDIGLMTGANVQGAGVGRLQRQNVGDNHIPDIHVISGLFSITVNFRRFSREQMMDKNSDDSRLSVSPLSGPVDIAIAQRYRWNIEGRLIIAQVILSGQFADTIRALGGLGMILTGGQELLLSVDRSPGRGVKDLLNPRALASFQQMNQAENIDARVELRIVHGTAHIHLGGMVVEDIRRDLAEQSGERGIKDIHEVKAGLRVQVPSVAAGEIIDDENLVACGNVGIDDMGSDKSRPSGYDDLHIVNPATAAKNSERSWLNPLPSGLEAPSLRAP